MEPPVQPPSPAASKTLHSILFDLAGSEAALGKLITQHLSEAHFTASQMVFEQQAVGDALYIVQAGRVQVSRALDTGQRQVLGEIGPGAREKSYPHAQTKAVSSGFQVTRKKQTDGGTKKA